MSTPAVIAVSAVSAILVVASLAILASELRGHLVPVTPGDQGTDEGRGERDGRSGLGAAGLAAAAGGWIRVSGAVIGAGLVWWGTGWPVAALACAAAVLAWPAFTAGRRTEQQEIDVLEAVVVWTQGLRDTVAGGASLEQAVGVSVEGASPALRPALEQVRSRMLVRHPLDAALQPLQEVPGADFVAAALTLAARRRGDRLPDVLSGIVSTCAQEVAQRRQILAARAGIHRSVQIIMAITVAILAWMATIGAAYMAPYDDATGQGVLALVIAVIAAGFLWLARLDTTVSGPRFFAADLSSSDHRVVMALAHALSVPAPAPGRAGGPGSVASPGSSRPAPRTGPTPGSRPRAGTDPSRQERPWP